ncbi:uncharacterized protein LOC130677582 [Microplitis mediator]|uniref:uncharacterized protein LOC130677582 n=1 Tax=Microplitis mediator TaxID=375433 RepID=UPI0025563A76|nr:uncharacterized protein LOC130677582 [Microplitis mediator]
MSVFASSDERILIEEIVEATAGEQESEAEFCSIDTTEENSLATVTLVDVSNYDQDPSERVKISDSLLPEENFEHILSSTQVPSQISLHNIENKNKVITRSHMEQEKRMRREIANSNERRRMQSINAGFQSLRTLLPHHEGEKLSKAAILQQTAEYIYQLEQEKTQLLSQNCQLKRLVNQHEGGDVPVKKRKIETQGVVVNLPIHVSESGDEGLGSMSPEPLSVITVSTDGHSIVSNNNNAGIGSEVVDLKRQLERERHQRLNLEKQLRAIQTQLYPERFRDNQLIAYQPHEVIEHTDNVMAQETEDAVATLQVVSVMSIPAVGSTQTVETSNPEPSTPPLSPQPVEVIAEEIMKEEEICPESPKLIAFATNNQIFQATVEEQSTPESFSPPNVTYKNEFHNNSTQFITASPTRPFSPPVELQRLPSVLEAAMKAEPKVEVERLPSPASSLEDGTSQARLYLANTSRQNLETIVEAIRHLEGDHLFSDEPAQDIPLALTNKTTTGASTNTSTKQRLLHAEVNNFLQFHSQQQPTQQRPGVIVVKQS